MRKRTASLAYENKHRAVIEKLFFEILIFLKEIKYLVCWIYFIFQVFKFKNGLSLFVSVKNVITKSW